MALLGHIPMFCGPLSGGHGKIKMIWLCITLWLLGAINMFAILEGGYKVWAASLMALAWPALVIFGLIGIVISHFRGY